MTGSLLMFRRCGAWIVTLLAAAMPAAATRLPARIFTAADGLGRDAVGCIVPDSRGFLWLCTTDGISRYDGYQFTNYGVSDGLAYRSVNAILETRSGVYLAATDLGISRFDPAARSGSSKRFVSLFLPDGRPPGRVNALLEDRSGVVWCGTDGGVYRIEGVAGGRPVLQFFRFETVGAAAVTSLAEDRYGDLWAGTSVGLCRRRSDGRVEWHNTAASGLPDGMVHAVLADPEGNLWVGTLAGLYQVPISPAAGMPVAVRRYGVRDGLASERIHSLLRSSIDGSIWVGTALALSRLDTRTRGREHFLSYGSDEGLSGRAVLSLGEDRQGNLWAGVDHGLERISRGAFTTYTSREGIGDLSIVQVSSPGVLAVSNQPEGILLHSFEGGRFVSVRPRYPPKMSYFGWGSGQVALRDREGDWWISTGEGLCRFPKAGSLAQLSTTTPVVYTTRSGLRNNEIFRLFEDHRGDLWISTAMGGALTRWDRRRGSFQHYLPTDCPGIASAFAEDQAGNLWIAFSNDVSTGRPSGLLRYRDGRFEQFPIPGDAPSGWILALYVDHSGSLWVGSTDRGLSRIQDPAAARPLVNYCALQGLSSTNVRCITGDPHGRIYIGTPHGVDRIEPASGRIRHFTTADGLPPGVPSGLYCDDAGRIWAATSRGLSMLTATPDRLSDPPRVYITGLTINGEPAAVPEPGVERFSGLQLRPDQRRLRIAFTGTGGAAGESIQYQYRVAGADGEWTAPSAERSVAYAGLGAGRFHFAVRAVTSGGISAVPAEVDLEVLPPVWQRWWFLSPAIAALATLVWAAHRYDLARRLQLEQMRLRIASDLHDDLGARLSRVVILTELVNRRPDGRDPESSHLLTEIADMSRGMVDGLGDLVWAIHPGSDDLADVARRVRRYATEVLEAQGIRWSFDTPPPAAHPALSPEQRRHLLLIYQEAIHNAAKHAKCSSVHLSLACGHGGCAAGIRDDGCGLPDPVPDSGNGLRNLRARAEALGGTLAIASQPGEGTEVTVSFPLKTERGRIGMLFRRTPRSGVNRL
ncbi:MAG TPA: two-component regulator propeller domain-containing protein [Bryobacteraceae bacterium]